MQDFISSDASFFLSDLPFSRISWLQCDFSSTTFVFQITTSESLLKLINEMKHNIIAHDYVKIRAQADAHIAACNAVSRETDQKILDLTGDIDMAIEELSESLYVSQERQHSRTS